jgi:hypothetical protein
MVHCRGCMDLQRPNPEVLRRMRDLLVASFDADQFRRFIADLEPAIIQELPGNVCSLATLVARGVDLLLQHAGIDLQYFERRAELRPKRRQEIFAIAGELGFLPSQASILERIKTLVAHDRNSPWIGMGSIHNKASGILDLSLRHLGSIDDHQLPLWILLNRKLASVRAGGDLETADRPKHDVSAESTDTRKQAAETRSYRRTGKPRSKWDGVL